MEIIFYTGISKHIIWKLCSSGSGWVAMVGCWCADVGYKQKVFSWPICINVFLLFHFGCLKLVIMHSLETFV